MAPEITIYTTATCPYCMRAKALLARKGVDYREVPIDGDPAARAAMMARAGGRTSVPQIFIDATHVGGCDDLHALDRDGKLTSMLAPRVMIKFALACAAGHAFESWFSDGAAYDTQVKRGFVQCPVCGSKQVGKAIMAPRVVTRRATPPAVAPAPEAPATPPPGAPAAPTAAPVALLDDKARELRAMIREVRVRMMAEAEDVGPRFATEARRIHDGAATERPIYGQATLADAQALLEDGIGVLPIPGLPDEHN